MTDEHNYKTGFWAGVLTSFVSICGIIYYSRQLNIPIVFGSGIFRLHTFVLILFVAFGGGCAGIIFNKLFIYKSITKDNDSILNFISRIGAIIVVILITPISIYLGLDMGFYIGLLLELALPSNAIIIPFLGMSILVVVFIHIFMLLGGMVGIFTGETVARAYIIFKDKL